MQKDNFYIPLIDMNFYWKIEQVNLVIKCYKKKMNITQISKMVKRSQDECAILIMDLGRNKKI